jgi:hypothetical protein
MFRSVTQMSLDKTGSLSNHTLRPLMATAPLDIREGDIYSGIKHDVSRLADALNDIKIVRTQLDSYNKVRIDLVNKANYNMSCCANPC